MFFLLTEKISSFHHLFFLDVLISSPMMVENLQTGTVEKVSRLTSTEEINELFVLNISETNEAKHRVGYSTSISTKIH